MNRVLQLKNHFDSVSETMAELPVFNPELSVTTVGFRIYQKSDLGVLVTPWCMNLIMIPDAVISETELAGTKQMLSLPSGHYEFIWGCIEGLGYYQSCSLFSPMFEFESQQLAIETAEEVMKALFEAENHAPSERQIATKAEQSLSVNTVHEITEEQENNSEEPPQLSRRGFLVGDFKNGTVESRKS